FSLPGGPGCPHLRGAGLAISESVQELRYFAGILAVDEIDADRADGVLDQLAVESVDEAVDGEHALARRAGFREFFDVALEGRHRSAAVQVLVLKGPVVVAPAD